MKTRSHYSSLTPEEKTIRFFQETGRELGVTSTRKLVQITNRIFMAIRKSLARREMRLLLSAIPGPLQLQVEDGLPHPDKQDKPVKLEHLDELVETIYEEEKNASSRLFHSEIEILNAVIIIIQELDKMTGLLKFPGFRFSLVREIRQVPFEEAA